MSVLSLDGIALDDTYAGRLSGMVLFYAAQAAVPLSVFKLRRWEKVSDVSCSTRQTERQRSGVMVVVVDVLNLRFH